MDKDFTVLMLIIDQSGSMGLIKEESQQALDELVKSQKEQPGKLAIKLVTFNHSVNISPLSAADDFEGVVLEPQGMTALHDAMGLGIKSLDKDITNLKETPEKVIVVTLTDGAENSSCEYTASSVKKLVDAFQKVENWEFLFLGANQDAITTAKQFGISRGSTMTYDASPEGVSASIQATTRYITDTRSGLAPTFTDEERNKSGLTGN